MLQRLSRLSARSKSYWANDEDLRAHGQHAKPTGMLGLLSLAFASIGVIYGDIGTSPLYVFSTIFTEPPGPQDVLCATSLVFWSITLVVLVKYVVIVLLADDNGEGGTFALYATLSRVCGLSATSSSQMPADKLLYQQAQQPGKGTSAGLPTAQVCADGIKLSRLGSYLKHQLSTSRALQHLLLFVTLVMTAMVLGDGVLTPCISVLSAVQGLQVKAGFNQDAVVGITCGILVLLFLLQSYGTQRVGSLFAPTVVLWFICNMLVAFYNIHMYEGASIFRAMSPHYIVIWFQRNGTRGWMKLAGVFLCLTGCEAMFADLGHFSRNAVRLSFTMLAYPSLIFTYFGQASWLMHNSDGHGAVFYNSIPSPVFVPIFIISVMAAIVASQALITGAFSIVWQSMALGCFPRLRVQHTSDKVSGQIYIAAINWMLLVLCIAVVAGFRSGTTIGNAYGIAVNMVMLGTVFLVSLVMLVVWGTHPVLVAAFFLPFAVVEGAFLSANLLNVPHGGWFSITMAAVVTMVSALWVYGSAEKKKGLQRLQFQLTDVLTVKRPDGRPTSPGDGPGLTAHSWQLYRTSNMSPVQRNPGMCLVYSESPFQVPAVFKRLVESWGVHSTVVFITVRQVPIPHVAAVDRLLLAPLEFKGFYRCVARYGYMDKVDQGPHFAQSVLDKIAQVAPNAAISDGLATTAPAASPVTLGASSKLVSSIAAGDAAGAAVAAGNAAPGANLIGAVACTVITPDSNTTPGAADGEITPAAAGPSHGAEATEVSELAGRAVYVLQCALICTQPRGSRALSFMRRLLLEQLYQPMWLVTTRFWQGIEAPVSRVFEVGMMLEL